MAKTFKALTELADWIPSSKPPKEEIKLDEKPADEAKARDKAVEKRPKGDSSDHESTSRLNLKRIALQHPNYTSRHSGRRGFRRDIRKSEETSFVKKQ
jgi:hypothetical protein